jgi:hypothetical protein
MRQGNVIGKDVQLILKLLTSEALSQGGRLHVPNGWIII